MRTVADQRPDNGSARSSVASATRVLLGPVVRPRHRREVDGRRAQVLLDGRSPYGIGHDDLVQLVAELTAPPAPGELRGEAEALLAFRAGRAYAAQGAPRHRVSPPVAVPARRAAPPASGMPVIGSVFAVAASAAIGVLAYTSSMAGPVWTVHAPGQPVSSVAGQSVDLPAPAGGGGAGAAAGTKPGGTQPRNGGSGGAGRGATRVSPGTEGSAVVTSQSPDGPNPVSVAGKPSFGPVAPPSVSTSPSDKGGGDSAPGSASGGGTSGANTPNRGEFTGGSNLGGASLGGGSAAAPTEPTATTPAPVASASVAPTPTPVPSATTAVQSKPPSLPALCQLWGIEGGATGEAASDPRLQPLVVLAGGVKKVNPYCASTVRAGEPKRGD